MATMTYVPSRLGEGFFIDVPIPGSGDDDKALTYDHGTGEFVYVAFDAAGTAAAAAAAHVAASDPHGGYLLASGSRAGTNQQFDGKVSLTPLGGYRGGIELETPGSLTPAPWRISTLTINPVAHDNVLLINYNIRNNDGGWERIVDGEHAIAWNTESRFHPTDPITYRGVLEHYWRLATATTGPIVFNRQPYTMIYDFDNHRSNFIFGDANRQDTNNTFAFTDGTMELANVAFYVRGSTFTDRCTFFMNSSADIMQQSIYDEANAQYLAWSCDAKYLVITARHSGGEFVHSFGANNQRYAILDGLRIGGGDTANTIYQRNGALGLTSQNGALTHHAAASYIAMITNGTERMRILNEGSIGIGTSSPGSKLDVAGVVQADGLRLDISATAETVTLTHTLTISINGVNYKLPCTPA